MGSFEQYKQYVEALFQPADTIAFAYISHDAQPVLHDFVPCSDAVKPEWYEHLVKANGKYSIFAAMNPYKAELVGKMTGRTESNVAEVKRLYLDADEGGGEVYAKVLESKHIPSPSVILNTSPGKYQFIWNVDGLDASTAKPLLSAMIREFGTDAACKDIARVLRVPGFVNRKYSNAPEVKVVGDIDGTRWDRVDFHFTTKAEPLAPTTPAPTEPRELIQPGHIHPWMVQQAGRLREIGLEVDEIETVLLRRVHEECAQPPDGFDNAKITKVARSMANYPKGQRIELRFTETEPKEEITRQDLVNQMVAEGKSTQEIANAVQHAANREFVEDAVAEKMPLNLLLEHLQAMAEVAVRKALKTNALADADWRTRFRSVGQLDQGEIKMLINGFMPEGTSFIGGAPGGAKTWFALSMVKALTTGKNFLGREDFSVPKVTPCLYLIPEVGARAFHYRLSKFHIPDDPELFLCRTISEGSIMPLNDPALTAAIQTMKPVVFLDTAIRFNNSSDENSASQNKALVDAMIALRQYGAVSVVALHHATKSMRKEGMTLENVLRGTGDLAASADCVYGLQRDDRVYKSGRGPEEIDVECLKPRDFTPPQPFRIATSRKLEKKEGFTISTYKDGLASNFDDFGDFLIVTNEKKRADVKALINQMLTENREYEQKDLMQATGSTQWAVKAVLRELGWTKKKNGGGYTKMVEQLAAVSQDSIHVTDRV